MAARKSSCGFSVMTFSGQVALHSPHCTQASSAKRSIGRSGSSVSAPVGQADTHERQSVQPATSISTDPNGARSGSGTTSTGAGAARCSSRSAKRSTLRLAPDGRKLAGRGVDGMRRDGAQGRAQRLGIVRLDGGDAVGAEAEALQDGVGQRDGARQSGDVVVRPRAQQKAHRRCAVGERRGDGLEAHLRDLVDGQRQHVGGQPVAEARQCIDQRRAVRIIVQQHDRRARRRRRDRSSAACAACASGHRPAAAHRTRRRSGRRRRTGRSRRRSGRRSPRGCRPARWRRSGRDRGSACSRRCASANARTGRR